MPEIIGEEAGKWEEVLRFAGEVRYGEVVIVLHDGRIVQIEKRQKKRFSVRKRLHGQSEIVDTMRPTGRPEA
jgi:hypothetical protein